MPKQTVQTTITLTKDEIKKLLADALAQHFSTGAAISVKFNVTQVSDDDRYGGGYSSYDLTGVDITGTTEINLGAQKPTRILHTTHPDFISQGR